MGAAISFGVIDGSVAQKSEESAARHESSQFENGNCNGIARRGPFRPDVWINSRKRAALRLHVYWYRGADVTVTTLLAIAWLTYPGSWQTLATKTVGDILPYVLAAWCALGLARSLDLYAFNRTRSTLIHAMSMMGAVWIGCLPALALQMLFGPEAIQHLLAWCAITAFALGGLHLIWAQLISTGRMSGALVPNVVIVGATPQALSLIDHAHETRDVNIIAVFDDRASRSPTSLGGVPVLGRTDQLVSSHVAPYIDTIAIAIDPLANDRIQELSDRLSSLPNSITMLLQGDMSSERSRRLALQRLARSPVAMLSGTINEDRKAFLKRLQDLIMGTVSLCLLLPLLIIVGLAVRLDSPGPALFRQKRHGFNQEIITVWKFRTMRHETADATAARQVTADDERVTRLGRFLRATSIDELPQLWNIVRGEMSLVGPRPHAIGMKTGSVGSASIVAEYAHRHRIKPGLTGWAAINGSRGPLHTAAEVRRRVQLDIEYIDRQSFWFDIWIILKTIPVLLGDRMASR